MEAFRRARPFLEGMDLAEGTENLVIFSEHGPAAFGPNLRAAGCFRKEDREAEVGDGIQVLERHGTAIGIMVIAIPAIPGYLKIVDQDDGVRPVAEDDLDFLPEREV